MAPGDNGGGKLTWPDVKEVCSPADIDRLACLAVAFLNTEDVDKAKYQAAADQFGGNIKPDSYKRSIWVITKKIKEAQSKNKRKASSEAPDAEDAEVTPTPKKAKVAKDAKGTKGAKGAKGGKGEKKATATVGSGGSDAADSPIKTEDDADGLDGIFE